MRQQFVVEVTKHGRSHVVTLEAAVPMGLLRFSAEVKPARRSYVFPATAEDERAARAEAFLEAVQELVRHPGFPL